MKVAYILGSLNRGGAETLTLDIFQQSLNFDVEFICIHRKEGDLYSDFKKTNIPLIHLRPKNLFDVFYILKLRRLLIRERVSIIHANQLIDSFISYLATLFLPIKTVLTFHGHGLNYQVLLRLLRWLALRKNALNIFVSQTQLNYYKKHYRKSSHNQIVLHNGISFLKFNQLHNLDLRKELSFEKDIPLSGSVGSFSNGRDQLTICKFLLLLNQNGFNFYHVFIGAKSKTEPWLYNECIEFCKKNKLSDKVFFLGLRKDVPAIVPQLDTFIYSTVHDTFGIAVIEAIAAEVPVFVNDWVVMKEITENGEYATLYKSKDEFDLYSKFIHFTENRIFYKEKAKLASMAVKKKFSIQKHIKQLIGIYSGLTKS